MKPTRPFTKPGQPSTLAEPKPQEAAPVAEPAVEAARADAGASVKATTPADLRPGYVPTLEEYVAAGYKADTYEARFAGERDRAWRDGLANAAVHKRTFADSFGFGRMS